MVDGNLEEFTRRASDILSTVALTGRIKRLDFLNIKEQSALESMVAKLVDVSVIFDGGFETAQRRRAVIFPIFMAVESIDVLVSIFKIEVIGTGDVTHSQVLGSLMALKIDRSVIGDIAINTNDAYFVSCSEFDEFLKGHFTKVGSQEIYLELVKERVVHKPQFEDVEIIASSMRLDVVVKALINASRGKASEYLNAGFVRLNHVVDKKPSRMCNVGDILSIRKHGRFKISEIKKITKSGKFVVVVSKNV